MAPFRAWADLPPELLLLISNGFGLPLESYCRLRRVCTTWRSALPPPTPMLITLPATTASILRRPTEPLPPVTALFLRAESSFLHLTTLPPKSRWVGSSNGWMAVTVDNHWSWRVFLSNPLAAGVKEIPLPRLWNDSKPVSCKIVFTPNPTPEDHVAVAISGPRTLAYAKAGDTAWTTIDDVATERDHLVDLAYDAGADTVYCITVYGDVRVLRIPRRPRQGGPVVEPLQTERAGLAFAAAAAAAAYAPPYDTASKFTGFKRIFFVGGSMYQLWRNTTSAVSWTMRPGGARFRMARDDVFVLKYDPGRRPCWDAATDLGGCAAFVGKNNPVVLRPGDAPGVRANCVYWIDEQSRNAPVVFVMATGASTLHPSAAKALSPSCGSSVCWYFLNDKVMSVAEDNGRKRRRSGDDCGHACLKTPESVLS